MPAAPNFIPAPIGQRFNRLVVLSEPDIDIRPRRWMCRCDCGTEKEFYANTVKTGHARSCGCYAREQQAIRSAHGIRGHRLYTTWAKMRERCENPKAESYRFYGARGIAVCERWGDFRNFLEDMEGAYRQGLTLDRIDNDGPYSPDNCRWATKNEQSRNTSRSVWVDGPNGPMILLDAARLVGISVASMRKRIRRGLTGADLFAPPQTFQSTCEPTFVHQFRVPTRLRPKLYRLGGAKWLRDQIENAPE